MQGTQACPGCIKLFMIAGYLAALLQYLELMGIPRDRVVAYDPAKASAFQGMGWHGLRDTSAQCSVFLSQRPAQQAR